MKIGDALSLSIRKSFGNSRLKTAAGFVSGVCLGVVLLWLVLWNWIILGFSHAISSGSFWGFIGSLIGVPVFTIIMPLTVMYLMFTGVWFFICKDNKDEESAPVA